MHACMHVNTCMYDYKYACMCRCVCAYIYTHIHIHIHLYTYMLLYVYMYMYMQMSMYVYMYVYTQLYNYAYTYCMPVHNEKECIIIHYTIIYCVCLICIPITHTLMQYNTLTPNTYGLVLCSDILHCIN